MKTPEADPIDADLTLQSGPAAPPPADAGTVGVRDGAWLEPGRTCTWLRHTGRLRVLIDAADYFTTLRAAMLRARDTIFIVGWDIDSRLQLTPAGARDGLPAPLA